MKSPKLTKLELKVMEALWNNGASSIREAQEIFFENERPAYTTVQTTVYRMENKNVVHRIKSIGNVYVFDASISRRNTHGKLIGHLLGLIKGSVQPVMSHLIGTGITLKSISGETVIGSIQ